MTDAMAIVERNGEIVPRGEYGERRSRPATASKSCTRSAAGSSRKANA